jgi:hypothetical protein
MTTPQKPKTPDQKITDIVIESNDAAPAMQLTSNDVVDERSAPAPASVSYEAMGITVETFVGAQPGVRWAE